MAAITQNRIYIEPSNFVQVAEALEKFTPALKEAVRESVRLTIPWAQKEVPAAILKRYAISRASLMDQSSRHGRWKMIPKLPTGADLNGSIHVVGTRMPVMRFSVDPRSVPNQRGIPVLARTPVTVRILRGGGVQRGKANVFLAKMKSGHTGVYRRKIPNPGGPRRRNWRADGQPTQLPITEEYMLSVPEMLAGKKLRKRFEDRLDKFLRNAFQKELAKIPRKDWVKAAQGMKALGLI